MGRARKYVAALLVVCGFLVGCDFLAGCSKERRPDKDAAMVALVANFVDAKNQPVDQGSGQDYAKSHLIISGQVYQQGAPVTSGAVKLTVTSTTYKFKQSMFFTLDEKGHFSSGDESFASIHPGSAVTITADLSLRAGSGKGSIELNSNSPAKKWIAVAAILLVLLVLIATFLFAFTGRTGTGKNRLAIQFSYGIIVLFLGVPIVAPVLLLRMFPAAVDGMIGYPAGLVVTRIGDPPHASAQWAINLGGYSHICVDQCKDTATLAEEAATEKAKADAAKLATQTAASKPASGDTPAASTPTPPTSPPNTPVPAQASGDAAAAKAPEKNSIAERDNSPEAEPSLAEKMLHPERLDPPIVKVEGGLVIPLYVIVLSVIGGAINMTRKVPGFQKEGEDVLPTKQLLPGTNIVQHVEVPAVDPALSIEDQAAAIDTALDGMIPAQVARNTDSTIAVPQMQALVAQMQTLFANNTAPTLGGYSNFDEWYVSRPRLREILGGSWRVELLNQYMYLISAPFLAIVTYFILDLLGLSKPAVIVVLSFSVGLISERIVTWILGIAAGYMQTPKT